MRLHVLKKERIDTIETIGRMPDGSDHQQVPVTKWRVTFHDGLKERELTFFSDPTDDDLLSAYEAPVEARPSRIEDRLEAITEAASMWTMLRDAAQLAASDGSFTPLERQRLQALRDAARDKLRSIL
jgi:hypothetical protein